MTSGAGSETLRLNADDEHYIVNWDTGQTGAEEDASYRIRVRVGEVVLGHATVQMVANGREARNADSGESIALIDGRTLPVKFRIETGIPGSLVVTPLEATIDVGETQEFTAEVKDLHGNSLSGLTVT